MKTKKVDLKYLINYTFGKISGIEWVINNTNLTKEEIELCVLQIKTHWEFIHIWREQYVSLSKTNKK